MIHGNLSNQPSISIAFRCEDTLFIYKNDGVKDKVLNRVLGKEKRAEVNPRVLSVMNNIYKNTEYTIDLVIQQENYTEKMKTLLDPLPFNHIVLITKETQILPRITSGEFTFYVDNNSQRLSTFIPTENAFDIQKLHQHIKIGR